MDLDRVIDELMREINEMLRAVNRQLEDIMKEVKERAARVEERPMVFGFTFGVRDNRPELKTFGDLFAKGQYRVPVYEQVLDEGRGELSVIIELPGIEKKDIRLEASSERLRLEAETGERKYRADIGLRREVRPETARASFLNGVLEVKFRVKEGTQGGFRPIEVQ
jgi:HSP20 family protein